MLAAPRLAITGVTGFVGQHVLRRALYEGCQVTALIRREAQKALLGLSDAEIANINWVIGALGEQDDALLADQDAVIHIAGLIKAKKRSDYMAVNCKAAGGLARAAAAQNVPRFVLLSSMAARQPALSDYAASKRAGEQAVRESFKGHLAILRAPAIFGPGDTATAPFFGAMEKGFLPVPGGRGWQKRRLSMTYVDDMAKEIMRAAVDGVYADETVSPATITDINWPEFAGLCSAAMGRPVKAMALPLALLYPASLVISVTSRFFGIGHLTRGKLREFCYPDWASQTLIPGATAPIDALKAAISSYKDA